MLASTNASSGLRSKKDDRGDDEDDDGGTKTTTASATSEASTTSSNSSNNSSRCIVGKSAYRYVYLIAADDLNSWFGFQLGRHHSTAPYGSVLLDFPQFNHYFSLSRVYATL